MSLAGKTAVITGGGSGIGAATAVAMARAGAKVMIAGRREAKLREVAASAGGAEAIRCHMTDVADRRQARSLIAAALEQFGHIDVLVLSAGINVKRRVFTELSPEDWDRHIDINLTGAFNCVHAAIDSMRARRSGLIVSVSSVAGKRGSRLGGAAYTASKFGIDGFTRTVGAEELQNGIRTCVVFPGEVDTEILVHRPKPVTDEHRSKMLRGEDVAAAIVFVASLPERACVPELIITPSYQEWT